MRSRELAALMERWRAQQEEISHVEAFINRFRYNASKARLVQSRITALEKIERIEVPPIVKAIHFSFPAPPPSGRLVLSAEGLAKSYAGRRVFSGVGFEVSRGDKLVVVGVNGAGQVHAPADPLRDGGAGRGRAAVGHRSRSGLLLAGERGRVDERAPGHRGAGERRAHAR